jgi:hypothetical protein
MDRTLDEMLSEMTTCSGAKGREQNDRLIAEIRGSEGYKKAIRRRRIETFALMRSNIQVRAHNKGLAPDRKSVV